MREAIYKFKAPESCAECKFRVAVDPIDDDDNCYDRCFLEFKERIRRT